MTTIRTNIPTTVFVAGQPITGRIWRPSPLMPTEAGADAVYYRARNTGKTRDVHAFLGIPYARQPVGPHRFKRAVKEAPSGPIDASNYGPVAPQGYSEEDADTGRGRTDLGIERGLAAWAALGTREGENCLGLSIWTCNPTSGANMPVVVQIHGGASNYLSGADDRMAGHRLSLKGVVVVRIEYRVGNLGHFWLPDMDGASGLDGTANFSITDAVAALEWVRDHIRGFGGDPDNVTNVGGSAGGNMCLCIAANPALADLWDKVWPSSASAGFIPRVKDELTIGMPSYQDWCGERHARITKLGPRLVDAADPSRTLADAISAVGISEAFRSHLRLQDFMALDEGRDGVAMDASGPINGFTATRSLTIVQDGKSVFHPTNRAAARAGAFPAKPMVIGVCENEYSVIDGVTGSEFFQRQLQHLSNGMTTRQWAESPIYSTEWNGFPASPSWGTLSPGRYGPPWTTLEPSRQIFNHGYAHAAYAVARAVQAAGANSWLYHFNYRALQNTATSYAGHTADEPYLFGNPPWDLPPPVPGQVEPLTTRDIYMAEVMSQALANFAATGNPNTTYASPYDFELFAGPTAQPFAAFDPVQKNWNVIGNPYRSARNAPATISNIPGFWQHAWDRYDAWLGNS